MNADRYWIGEYDSNKYQNHWNDDGKLTSISDKDSALAVSWNVSLAAGESKIYSVIVGVGEVADPPAWDATDPVTLSMSAEATPDNLLIHVNAKVKDANGVIDTLYYNENGGEEQQLGNSVTGDGTTEKEITGVIDLTGKEDGTYTYQFWIVNNKGATSEVVTRTITITNGEVSGDVVTVVQKYNVRVISPANGSLTASKNGLVDAGIEITLTATPAEDYKLKTLTVTDAAGNPVTVTDYKFIMPASNVTVEAVFEPIHTHNWVPENQCGDGRTVRACCVASDCPIGYGGTLTLEAPALVKFGGTESAEATLTQGEGVFPFTWELIYLSEDGTQLNEAPTNAGTYEAKVLVFASDNTNTAASVTYTIAKADNSLTAPTAKTLTYNEAEQELVTAGSCTHGELLYSLNGTAYTAEIPKATNAGEYTVYYKVDGADNYENVAPQSLKSTLSAKSMNADGITVVLSDDLIFVGDAIPTLTVKDGDAAMVKDNDYTVTQSDSNGLFTLVLTGKGNYQDTYSVSLTYQVVSLPNPDKVKSDDKDAIDVYDRYLELNKTYQDEELAKKLEALQKALTAYDVIKCHKSSYTKRSGKTFCITANGYLGKFTCLKVDGKLLDPKYYTVKSDGGTVVTLNNSYLNCLIDGKHTIEFLYTDGTTGGNHYFRIASNNGSPFTGDNSLLCMAMVVMFTPRKKGRYQR